MIRRPLSVASSSILVSLACAALGCAANRPELTCPKSGGPGWTEIKSPHFMLETDLPEPMGRKVALDMERSRAALLSLLGAPADEAATPIELVLFERERDFAAALGREDLHAGFLPGLPSDVEDQRVIASSGAFDEGSRILLQHEVTHEILRRRTARIPWWLDEGLAEACSTIRIDGDKIILGEPVPWSDFWDQTFSVRDMSMRIPKVYLTKGAAPAFADILSADRTNIGKRGEPRAYYTAAWKLVRVIRGDFDASLAPRFATLLEAMMGGTNGWDAFAQAYGDLPPTTLQDAYQKTLLDLTEHVQTIPFHAPANPSVSARGLSDAEVHALWVRLRRTDSPASATKELERGLAENPGAAALLYARATLHLMSKNDPIPLEDIQALRRLDPYNPRYVLLDVLAKTTLLRRREGQSLGHDEQVEAAALFALLLRTATSPVQRVAAAIGLMLLGRYEEARVLVEGLVKANPTCGPCLSVHGELLLRTGDPRGAKEAAERSLSLLPETDPGKLEKNLIQRADAAMNKAAPSPAPP